MLTKKQQEYFTEYYLYDKTLNEIACDNNVSRNAVHDSINKISISLYNYEKQLEIVAKKEQLSMLVESLENKTISLEDFIKKVKEIC